MIGMRKARWRLMVLAAVTAVLPTLGCGTTNTERGLSTGGILGAAVGAIAGGPRHALAGAALGGLAGAAVGGVAGSSADNAERKMAARQAAAHPPLTLEQIVSLTSSGMSDGVIINQIRNSGSVYNLQPDHLLYLQQNGVREPVISYMQATAAQPIYTAVPVAQPYYVGPPAVGVGIGFRR